TSPHFKYYDNPQKEKQKSEFTERRNFKMGGVIFITVFIWSCIKGSLASLIIQEFLILKESSGFDPI
ncbi:hypothetical protein AKJ51_03625, partial [candidate division MSBL1 archaeon SCGC-AAA382A20]